MPVDSALSQHLQIEAMKLGFADAYEHVADMRGGMRLTPAQMLDDAYLAGARQADRPEAGAALHARPRRRAAARSTSAPPTSAA